MRMARATRKIPNTVWEMEQNVLYYGEAEYDLNGIYRFWVTKPSKFGQHTISAGFYHGTAESVSLKIPKEGAVCFDRFPYPVKEGMSQAPVADLVEQDSTEERILAMVDRMVKERLGDKVEDSVQEEIRQLIREEEDDEDEMYVSGYGEVPLPEESDLSPEDPKPNGSEADYPRVGGGREAGGSKSEKESSKVEVSEASEVESDETEGV